MSGSYVYTNKINLKTHAGLAILGGIPLGKSQWEMMSSV